MSLLRRHSIISAEGLNLKELLGSNLLLYVDAKSIPRDGSTVSAEDITVFKDQGDNAIDLSGNAYFKNDLDMVLTDKDSSHVLTTTDIADIKNNIGCVTFVVTVFNGHFIFTDSSEVDTYILFNAYHGQKPSIAYRMGTTNNVVFDTIVNEGDIITFRSTGTAYKCYINGVEASVESGTDNGNWISDIAGLDRLNIGKLRETSAVFYHCDFRAGLFHNYTSDADIITIHDYLKQRFASKFPTFTVSANIPAKTQAYTTDGTYIGSDASHDYVFAGDMVKNPVSGKIVEFIPERAGHVDAQDTILRRRESTDNGDTWSSITTIIDEAPIYTPINVSCGYDSNGRLHMLTRNGGSTRGVYYLYSDDDGITWSSKVGLSNPDVNLTYNIPFGPIIFVDGVLYCCAYGITDVGDFTESSVYTLKSVDNGVNWAWNIVKPRSSAYVNESTIFHLGGSKFGIISRVEATARFRLYLSSDNGENWTQRGSDKQFVTATHPPLIVPFVMEGNVPCLALYYTQRGTNGLFKVSYCVASKLFDDALNPMNAFVNEITLETFTGDSTRSGYPSICHYDNNLAGLYSVTFEVSIDEAYKKYGKLPTTGYDTLKTALGI